MEVLSYSILTAMSMTVTVTMTVDGGLADYAWYAPLKFAKVSREKKQGGSSPRISKAS